jgi:hypothetical protein
MSNSRHASGWRSRRAYFLDDHLHYLNSRAAYGRTRQELQELLDLVWRDYTPRRRKPVLKFVRTGPTHFLKEEFYHPQFGPVIQISSRNMTDGVLLHEVTHAMGFWEHGPRFLRRFIDLLVRYCGAEEGELVMLAGLAGAKVAK